MKIEDLSFIAEVTEENTNSINGGNGILFDPVARAMEFNQLVFSGASQNEIGLYLFNQSLEDTTAIFEITGNIEPTVF